MKASYEVVAVVLARLLSAVFSITEIALVPGVLVLAGMLKNLAGKTGRSTQRRQASGDQGRAEQRLTADAPQRGCV